MRIRTVNLWTPVELLNKGSISEEKSNSREGGRDG